jgi:2-polyprenyl-3-methyl-5-hydroxy-6-metoxy-1,4-benzoquinol methylase
LTAEHTAQRVDPAVYTEHYYTTSCDGHEDFTRAGGRRVGPRFRKALALAGDLRGARVLDAGCGRGELVVQAALRGAQAWGIDYAEAAVEIASDAIAHAGISTRAHVQRGDLMALEFADGSFDVAFMMDVVEHLYPDELTQALGELRRVLRPGGRLVVHTSPNTLLQDVVYPHYTRRVHAIALKLSEITGFRDRLFTEFMLPSKREFPRGKYECETHVNEQSAPKLRQQLEAGGWRVARIEFWEPPMDSYFEKWQVNTDLLKVLDLVRFLRPLSFYPPLNRFFCNHIWMTAEKT